MHIVYIDDSRDEQLCVFSALVINVEEWRNAFNMVKEFRRRLRDTDGIFVYKEIHAWKFVSGRGRISNHVVTKGRRCEIFRETLQLVASLPRTRLFNAVFPKSDDEVAFEHLLNRINRTMKARNSHAILICDEGKEAAYTLLSRRMGVHNPIPSQYGSWPGGGVTKNIPIERIIEDPIFKGSDRSYFIQLSDCCAYALLRREHPIPSKSAYGLNTAFDLLKPILFRGAHRTDPEGIIRPKKSRAYTHHL